MAKVISKGGGFAVNGGGKSSVTSGASPQVAGRTSGPTSEGGKWATGGSSKMAGFSGVGSMGPGDVTNPMNGNTTFGVKGGSTKMQPHRGSQRQVPGRTSNA